MKRAAGVMRRQRILSLDETMPQVADDDWLHWAMSLSWRPSFSPIIIAAALMLPLT
jgi:hypothetical protein